MDCADKIELLSPARDKSDSSKTDMELKIFGHGKASGTTSLKIERRLNSTLTGA
ncbi:MAG: hypothetical protein LBT58_05195 [Endomicrobium sp.]|nr:hypothetical protein [Endomicrobium sp.]